MMLQQMGRGTMPTMYALERGLTEPELKVWVTEASGHGKEWDVYNATLQATLEPMFRRQEDGETIAAEERRSQRRAGDPT
jgi:hypothetical protein